MVVVGVAVPGAPKSPAAGGLPVARAVPCQPSEGGVVLVGTSARHQRSASCTSRNAAACLSQSSVRPIPAARAGEVPEPRRPTVNRYRCSRRLPTGQNDWPCWAHSAAPSTPTQGSSTAYRPPTVISGQGRNRSSMTWSCRMEAISMARAPMASSNSSKLVMPAHALNMSRGAVGSELSTHPAGRIADRRRDRGGPDQSR